jgi:uncharacterized protein YutD
MYFYFYGIHDLITQSLFPMANEEADFDPFVALTESHVLDKCETGTVYFIVDKVHQKTDTQELCRNPLSAGR